MKSRQRTKIYGNFPFQRIRGQGLLLTAALIGVGLTADPLFAAIDPADGKAVRPALALWTVAQSTAPPAATAGDAIVPPVRREAPAKPASAPAEGTDAAPANPVAAPAAAPALQPSKTPDQPPQTTAGKAPPPAPDVSGVFGAIQEWLARANREYQGVVVKELSLPAPASSGDDAIAKTLQEQQAEDAQKAAAARRAEDAKRQAADDKATAAAKAADAKKLDEDRRRADETKRLADEAKKKADELLKAEQPAPKAEPRADVAAPAAPPAPKADDAAALAEQKRLEAEKLDAQKREAQKLADEAKRQEQARQDKVRQEQARNAEEARRVAADRAKAESERAAAAKSAAAKRAAETARPAVSHSSRTIVLTPEPIARPVDPGTTLRPEMARRRTASSGVSEGDAEVVESRPQRRRIRVYHEDSYRGLGGPIYRDPVHRGPAVKRWVARDTSGHCTAAGRRITPPARYTVKRGDSLWRISERHYHQGRLYPKIHSANRATIPDPDLIYPCQRVLVPKKR